MQSLGYLAALAAATTWALSSLLTVGPVRELGAIAFNTFRMLCVALALSVLLLMTGNFSLPSNDLLWPLIASGFIGIFLGDTFLFGCVKRLGPRMSGLLFSTNAPMSFVIGIYWLDETYQLVNFLGVALVTSGVMLALVFRRTAGTHHWEQSMGNVGTGILAGILAALCQSLGTFIAFDAMQAGTHPATATTIRVWVAFIFLFLTLFISRGFKGFHVYQTMKALSALRIIASGFLGMGLGMSLLLWAIKVAPVGIVATLSATTPVIMLPIVWLLTKERPQIASIWAAVTVVAGVALVFSSG